LGEVLDLGDQLRIRLDTRVGAVEAVDVGEQDEQAGVEQDRHLGGEEVVVAEGDLVGRRCVVLVDHGHDPPLEQLAQRLARVEVVRARAHVEERQQHLRALDPARAQQLVVGAVELALADRAGRLQLVHRARARAAPRRGRRQIQQPHPARDRAAGDDHDVAAIGVHARDLVAD